MMTFASFIAVALFALFHMYLWRSNLDRQEGLPFIEEVEVKERLFSPGGFGPIAEHSSSVQQPKWSLRVASSHGQGWVEVGPQLYETTAEGEKLFVRGVRGKFTARWYLDEASKTQLIEAKE